MKSIWPISLFSFYSEVKIKDNLKLTSGGIPAVTKPEFFGSFFQKLLTKNKDEIVYKVILGALHLRFTLVLYLSKKYGWDKLSTNAKDRG